MNQGETAKLKCLKCKVVSDAFTGIEDETKPSDGDLSICYYCGNVTFYAENVTQLKQVTDEDMEKIKIEDPEAYGMVIRAVKHINKMKNN